MKIKALLFLLALFTIISIKAQVSITDNTGIIIDLGSVIPDVVNGPYAANGKNQNPSVGELDSDAWSVISPGIAGDFNFGQNGGFGSGTEVDFRNTEGFYTSELLGPGNFSWQIMSRDGRSSTIKLKIVNNTGDDINSIGFSFPFWVANDSDGSTKHWVDGQAGSFIFDFSNHVIITPSTAASSPIWEPIFITSYFIDLTSDPLQNGEEIIFQIQSLAVIQDPNNDRHNDDASFNFITIEPSPTLGNAAEPSSHVSQFEINNVSKESVEFNVTPSDAERYLVVVSNNPTVLPVITDGIYYNDDNDFSDNHGFLNITNFDSPLTFYGLDPLTQYYFQIYPYNNLGANADYKTDGIIPGANAFTWGDGTRVINGSGRLAISSIDPSTTIEAFTFEILEDDLGDNERTNITDLIIRPGLGNEISDWTQLIENVKLETTTDGGGIGTESITGTVFPDRIEFNNIPSSFGRISDGYLAQLSLQLDLLATFGGTLPSSIDGKHLVFSIDGTDITTDPVGCASCGGVLATDVNFTDSGVGNNEITVEATQLVFTTPPLCGGDMQGEPVGATLFNSIVVEAQDINGNRDLDINSLDNLSTDANLNWINEPSTFIDGVLSFPVDFQYLTAGNTNINVAVSGLEISSEVCVRAYAWFTTINAGLASSTLYNNDTDIAIVGFGLDTDFSTITLNNLSFTPPTGSENVTGQLTNLRLASSSDNVFDGIDIDLPIGSVTYDLGTFTLSNISEIISPTTKYFFLVADVDITASANTPDLMIENITPTFSSGSATQIIPQNNSKTYSFLDANPASPINIETNTTLISEEESTFAININYSEEMDVGGANYPIIVFPDEDPSSSLTLSSQSWLNSSTYQATYSITDNNIDLADIDVQISGGIDGTIAGPANGATFSNVFSINTTNAIISEVNSSKPSGEYAEGELITISVVFDRIVNLSGGTLTLSLNTGSTATYSSGSGTNTLIFTYTVLTCEETPDLDYEASTSLLLNGSSLVDDIGNVAYVELPEPGQTGSLSVNESIVISKLNHAPIIDAISSPSAISEDAAEQIINLSGISANDCDPQVLTVTAISSNTSIIPHPTVSYTSPESIGSISYTPVPDAYGTATISITISDDGGTNLGGVDNTVITFDVEVLPVNDMPFIENANFMVNENSLFQSLVGQINFNDADALDNHSLSITDGNIDNVFSINSLGEIRVSNSSALNYESANKSYSLTVMVQDDGIGALSNNAEVNIIVNDVNDAPYDIEFLVNQILEGTPSGTVIGKAVAKDEDRLLEGGNGDSHTYLVLDNSTFEFGLVDPDKLKTTRTINSSELGATLNLTIRATDSDGKSIDRSLGLLVVSNSTNVAPAAINVVQQEVPDHNIIGNNFIELTTQDNNSNDIHTYELVDGEGSTHNDNFRVNGNWLVATKTFDVKVDSIFSVRVKTTDNGSPALSYVDIITFMVIPFVDSEKPTIDVDTPPEFVDIDEVLTISATITDNTEVKMTTLHYKGITDVSSSYSTIQGVAGENDKYTFEVAPTSYGGMGVEFFLSATDTSDNVVEEVVTHKVYLSFESYPITEYLGHGGGKTDWRLLSIPYELDNSPGFKSIFAEYGVYNRESWRLVQWKDTGDGTGEYIDLPDIDAKPILGEGYWFNARGEEKNINIGPGKVYTNNLFELKLKSGFNQIGNPFNVPISWNNVLADGINNPDVTGIEPLQVFEGGDGPQMEGDVLYPFNGGFVFSVASATITIDPTVARSTGGRLEEVFESSDLSQEEWKIDLSIIHNSNTRLIGSLGMHPEALKEKDRFDQLSAPRFQEYAEILTKHDEFIYPWFRRDIVTTSNQYTWDFTFETNISEENVKLSWFSDEFGNGNEQLLLYNKNNGDVIDMRIDDSYTVKTNMAIPFAMYFNRDVNATFVPKEFVFGEAYPNPSNGLTIFPVILPESKISQYIELTIYTIQGHVIDKIAQGYYSEGVHQFHYNFNENHVKNGIYVYELRLGGSNQPPMQKKIVINH